MSTEKKSKKPLELALIGEVDDWENDIVKELLEAKTGRECVFYIDSMGGSVYGALAVTTLMRRQGVQLGYFTEGNVPSGILNVPHGWQADAIKPMQERLANAVHAVHYAAVAG